MKLFSSRHYTEGRMMVVVEEDADGQRPATPLLYYFMLCIGHVVFMNPMFCGRVAHQVEFTELGAGVPFLTSYSHLRTGIIDRLFNVQPLLNPRLLPSRFGLNHFHRQLCDTLYAYSLYAMSRYQDPLETWNEKFSRKFKENPWVPLGAFCLYV